MHLVGLSSPAKPTLHVCPPLSMTRRVTSDQGRDDAGMRMRRPSFARLCSLRRRALCDSLTPQTRHDKDERGDGFAGCKQTGHCETGRGWVLCESVGTGLW